MVNVELSKSTFDMFGFDRTVKKVLSDEKFNLVVKILKSDTERLLLGKAPVQILATVATPEIVTLVVPTLTIFAITGSELFGSLY